MGSASKVISVFLRLGELASAVIVLGIVGWFLSAVNDANAYADPNLTYITVIACISVFLSIVLILPFTYSFLAFPMDFIMFVLWLVAFCLEEALTGVHTCNASWYWNYWGFYWGGFWRRPTFVVNGPFDIGWSGCASWRTVIAFSFISSMIFLISSILGGYVIVKYREEKRQANTVTKGLAMATPPVPIGPDTRGVRNGVRNETQHGVRNGGPSTSSV